MTTFLLHRLALIVPTLFFVSVLIFGLQQLLPGDPALALAGEERDPAVIAFLREKYHLDRPLPVRYALWIAGVAHGDLGESIRIKRPVLDLILEKLPVSGELARFAILIALTIGVPSGILAAVKNETAVDYGATMAALWGLSIPNFWLGILLILLFSVELGWLPASGFVSPAESLKQNLMTLIMPAFVLGNAIAAGMMRHMRSAMLQVLDSDYIRTARAKGLPERRVVLVHGLRNALMPVITLGALDLGGLLSGAVLTEQVFTIPGFGCAPPSPTSCSTCSPISPMCWSIRGCAHDRRDARRRCRRRGEGRAAMAPGSASPGAAAARPGRAWPRRLLFLPWPPGAPRPPPPHPPPRLPRS